MIEEVCEAKGIKLGKVNVDDEMDLAEEFNVQSIPFVVKFVDGQVVDSFVGLKPKSAIEEFVK